MINKKRIIQIAILMNVFFYGCASLGENFFVVNYEDQPVNIKYIYYSSDNITNSTDFRYQPQAFVLLADTILPEKAFKQFPYKSDIYFDSLDVKMIDSLSYEFNIPSKSTIRVAPIYYGDNIEYLILNNKDTIKFMADEYSKLANEDLVEKKIIKYKFKLMGDSYYVLNLKLNEIEEILNK